MGGTINFIYDDIMIMLRPRSFVFSRSDKLSHQAYCCYPASDWRVLWLPDTSICACLTALHKLSFRWLWRYVVACTGELLRQASPCRPRPSTALAHTHIYGSHKLLLHSRCVSIAGLGVLASWPYMPRKTADSVDWFLSVWMLTGGWPVGVSVDAADARQAKGASIRALSQTPCLTGINTWRKLIYNEVDIQNFGKTYSQSVIKLLSSGLS